MSLTALDTFLAPLKKYFAQPAISEISINQPKEIWVETGGDMTRYDVPEFDLNHLKSLGRLVAQATEQKLSEEMPLLSATLPEGFRIQIVFPPACEPSTVAISIRKATVMNLDLDQYEAIGAFQNTIVKKELNPVDKKLRDLLNAGAVKEFIKEAVLAKKILSSAAVLPPAKHIFKCDAQSHSAHGTYYHV